MLGIGFIRWWYGAGWKELIRRILKFLVGLERSFSVGLIMRTLFAPWRQIVSYSDSFVDSLRAGLDNLVSRAVGLGVRLLTLSAAGILMALTVVVGVASAIIWPLVPLAAIGLIIYGVIS